MAAHAPLFESHHVGPVRRYDLHALRFVVPLGRVLFALIFVASMPHLFAGDTIGFARQHGVPLPEVAVPLAGILALVGGLSVAIGFHARIGAWLLILFLVPVTLFMHAFWAEVDPAAIQMQQVNFMKNLALLGGALMLTYFGSGPISVDARIPARYVGRAS